ncbi:IclR family transcriptional regulator [Thioclava sp. 15-R06ZXC-3]|uniref:IclR family transcriptional regulator n=1 Tax=Thioclava arctica TaxID=3238301 RepID=A0ABV3TNH6_9RHOB
MKPKGDNLLQTLRRGMDVFTLVAERSEGLNVAQISEHLGVDRAIAYRLVATLEADGFVARGAEGRVHMGGAVLALAAAIEPQLRSIAEPALRRMTKLVGATAFMTVARGNEAVAILTAEAETGVLRVGYRPGSRHPLNCGAAGLAILSARAEHADDSDAVREARRDGYSLSQGQLQRGAIGIAAPLRLARTGATVFEASVGVVTLDDLDPAQVAPHVIACATEISATLGF